MSEISMVWFDESAKLAETLICIDAPHFAAAVVVIGGKVVRAAPILKYMRGWPEAKVRDYVAKKGWRIV